MLLFLVPRESDGGANEKYNFNGQTIAIPTLEINTPIKVLHPTPYTLHPTPNTLHPTPYTLHPTPYRGASPKRKRNPP